MAEYGGGQIADENELLLTPRPLRPIRSHNPPSPTGEAMNAILFVLRDGRCQWNAVRSPRRGCASSPLLWLCQWDLRLPLRAHLPK